MHCSGGEVLHSITGTIITKAEIMINFIQIYGRPFIRFAHVDSILRIDL